MCILMTVTGGTTARMAHGTDRRTDMNKVKMTQEEFDAVQNLKREYDRSLEWMFNVYYAENNRFCGDAEPLNRMLPEQIIKAFFNYSDCEIKPDYEDLDKVEAFKALLNGEVVEYIYENDPGDTYDPLNIKHRIKVFTEPDIKFRRLKS